MVKLLKTKSGREHAVKRPSRRIHVRQFVLVICILTTVAQGAESDIAGVTLVFGEDSAGENALTTTMFVNKSFMHISDDAFPEDFILFDRKKQTINIVTTSERTIFVIRKKAIKIAPPLEMNFKETLQVSSDRPTVENRKVSHYTYTTNGKLCYEAAVLPADFLTEASRAMYEFKQVMAGEHATTLGDIPESMITACDIAQNIFHAGAHLTHGVPVRVWTPQGYQRYLKNYQTQSTLPASAFFLPVGYERFSVGDILNEDNN